MSEALAARMMQHAATRESLTSRVVAAVLRAWQTLGTWDREDMERFNALALPLVEGAQAQTGALTNVYLTAVLAEMLGLPELDLADLDPDEVTNLRPVTPAEEYARPFITYWTALKNGDDPDVARDKGADRLTRLVEDDISLSSRRATLAVIDQHDEVTGYRRVIRPELSTLGTCGLCIAASNQVYTKRDLMPIHTRCNCEVMPIIGEMDPGREINGVDIDALYQEAKAEANANKSHPNQPGKGDLAAVRFQVYEHGELGPTLAYAEHDTTGPADLAA